MKYTLVQDKPITIADLKRELNKLIKQGYSKREILLPNGTTNILRFHTDRHNRTYLMMDFDMKYADIKKEYGK